jgi:putative flippase GtrA
MHERIIKFILVGVFNTVSNLVLFNLFIFITHWSIGLANIIATTISICISFWLNAHFVFRHINTPRAQHVFMLFLVTSIFSQFIVQQAALLFFLHIFTWPAHVAIQLAKFSPLTSRLSDVFYRANIAKCLAVGISMAVNFILYDRIVFTLPKKVNDKTTEELTPLN